MKSLKNVRIGMIYALPAAILTSVSIVLVRYLLKNGENPLNLTAWITLFTIIPWMFLLQKHYEGFKKLSLKMIGILVFAGIAGAMGVNYLQALALQNTTAVNYAFIYRTIVIFTVIFAWIFFKEKLTLAKGFIVTAILFGTFLITTDGQSLTLSSGDLYSLLVAASAALISNILVKHTMSKMHTELSGSVISIVGAISLLVFAIGTGVFRTPKDMGLVILGSLSYFSMLFLRNRAFKHATASFVSLIFGISPIFVVVLSYFFLGETLESVQLIGGVIILVATIFTEKFKM